MDWYIDWFIDGVFHRLQQAAFGRGTAGRAEASQVERHAGGRSNDLGDVPLDKGAGELEQVGEEARGSGGRASPRPPEDHRVGPGQWRVARRGDLDDILAGLARREAAVRRDGGELHLGLAGAFLDVHDRELHDDVVWLGERGVFRGDLIVVRFERFDELRVHRGRARGAVRLPGLERLREQRLADDIVHLHA